MATINYNTPIGVELASYIDPAGMQTKATKEWTITKPTLNVSLVLTTTGAFDLMNGTGTIDGFQVKTPLLGGVPTAVVTASNVSFDQDITLEAFLAKLAVSADAAAEYLLSADDEVIGSTGKDLLQGFAGDDQLFGAAEDDTLVGGPGFDSQSGGIGNDTFIFNAGDGGATHEIVSGDDGTDTLRFEGSVTVPVFFMDQIERLQFGAAATVETSQFIGDHVSGLTIIGSAGANTLSFKLLTEAFMVTYDPVFDFSTYAFQSWGPEDRFLVTGTASADLIRGPRVAASIDGGLGDDYIIGGAGGDSLTGGTGADTLAGGKGSDTYVADGLDEILESAGGGLDTILTAGSFSLSGHAYVENLALANAAAKTSAKLTGNALANTITGDAGANTLAGGLGKDVLDDGARKDLFLFNTALGKTNVDTIVKYSVKDDTVRLENKVFKALGKAGKLDSDAFHKGKGAADAEDRVIYDSKTGALYYDPDGVGGAAQVKFAVLSKKLALTHADFVVI
jgi:Ca2+-binding RTX toxin-like protein